MLHHVRDATLARLAVDANDRFVRAPDIFGIDRKIRHFPDFVATCLACRKPLFDRILMRTRERGEHELAAIRMAFVHAESIAILDRAHDFGNVREIESRIDALREEIERERHHIDVARALAVAEERALDALATRHLRELGGRHRGAAIVVRMHGEHVGIARPDVAAEPFDLIGVHVRRRHLDRRRQVEDHLLLWGGLPHVHHRFADIAGEVELGPRKALRRIFEAHVRAVRLRGQLLYTFGRAHGDVDDAGPVETEHHTPLQGRGRVIDVNDRSRHARNRFERPVDQLVAGLREHLNRHVVRNEPLIDELADEIEIRLRG